jgi:hypothetical protein
VTGEEGLTEFNDWNRKVIDEFRANGGKVGGVFEGATILLLHSRGAKTQEQRINPLAYVRDGGRFVVIAAKGSAPTNPDWYHNIVRRETPGGSERAGVRPALCTYYGGFEKAPCIIRVTPRTHFHWRMR